MGRRGAFAVEVKPFDSQNTVTIQGIRGEVVRDFDLHRSTPGSIESSDTSLPSGIGSIFPFRMIAEGLRRTVKCSKGDEVKFDLRYNPSSSYCVATNISLVLSKRVKKRQQVVDEMIAAGATVERGVVDHVIADYGFISPENRSEEIYFRTEDVLSEEGTMMEVKKVK